MPHISSFPVLDAGCGVGFLTAQLKSAFQRREIWSCDSSRQNINFLVSRGINEKSRSFVCNLAKKGCLLGFPKFGTIILADVIEHIKDDQAVLDNCFSSLRRGGSLVITVPYSMNLWNPNDESRAHVRRYELPELRQKLLRSGFVGINISKRNVLALPFIFAAKLFSFRVPHESACASPLNSLLKAYYLNFEEKIAFPTGSELIATAKKP